MNPSNHDILIAFYWMFIVIPGVSIFVGGIVEFFSKVTNPPRSKVPAPGSPEAIKLKQLQSYEEHKKETTWCSYCNKNTTQKLSRYSPTARFYRRCEGCDLDPMSYYDRLF